MVVFLSLSIFLSGCLGRSPNPVDATRDTDSELTCEIIQYVIKDSENSISDLRSSQVITKTWNVIVTIGAIAASNPWVLLLWTSSAASVEIRAYEERIEVLKMRAKDLNCVLYY